MLEEMSGGSRFVGLAPFLRSSIAGEDLLPLGQVLLTQANNAPEDIDCLMNLAVLMQCIGNRAVGLSLLGEALSQKATYVLPQRQQPVRARLLLLMAPGDISANTPLDCLLEGTDLALTFHYLNPTAPTLENLPEHDVLFVAISEGDEFNVLLHWLVDALAGHDKPVINLPADIVRLGRDEVSQYLGGVAGLCIPETLRVYRAMLESLATGEMSLADIAASLRFPVILRPVGSHGGHGLEKLENPDQLGMYLAKIQSSEFYLANFIDYRSADGMFRKLRVVLVDGNPYIAHVGISAHWMIHYLNAGMYEDALKREQEAELMANFAEFAQRHQGALAEIYQRSGLDYLCIDCAETPEGELLVFEIGNAMVVHAMDPVDLFPYKPPLIARIVDAFYQLLFKRIG